MEVNELFSSEAQFFLACHLYRLFLMKLNASLALLFHCTPLRHGVGKVKGNSEICSSLNV